MEHSALPTTQRQTPTILTHGTRNVLRPSEKRPLAVVGRRLFVCLLTQKPKDLKGNAKGRGEKYAQPPKAAPKSKAEKEQERLEKKERDRQKAAALEEARLGHAVASISFRHIRLGLP